MTNIPEESIDAEAASCLQYVALDAFNDKELTDHQSYDLNRDTSPQEGGGLGSGDLLNRAAADHPVCDSVVSNAI